MKTIIPFYIIFLFLISNLYSQDKKGVVPIDQNVNERIGTTRAVIVGISDYQDEDIPDLRFADQDAEAFTNYLRSPAGGSVPDGQIILLQNKNATNARIADALIWLLEESMTGDQAIIYFSGHGDVETITRFNRGYLLTYDSPPKIYMAGAFNIRDLQDIISTLSDNEVRVLMISDACRAGKLAGEAVGGTQATAQNLSQQFANEVKILSCQPNEFSLEGEQWGGGRGAFSYHLLDGLHGLADKNGDAQVNLFEIGRYLEDHVPEETAPHSQIPFTVGDRNTSLAAVDESALALLAEQKATEQPQLAKIATKGLEELLLSKADTGIQLMYADFIASLERKKLLEPAGTSAYDLYLQLSNEESLSDLHNIMRRNLAVALQDDAQQAVNAYLAANPAELQRRYENEQDYSLYPRYLEKAGELLGSEHFYFDDLRAKRYYFEGLGLRLAGEQEKIQVRDSLYKEAIQLQLKALKYQNRAPFVLNELGILHIMLKQDKQAIQYLEQAIEISPEWALPYVNYCVGSYYSNDDMKAKEMGEKALERMSDYPQMYNFLGYIYSDYSYYRTDKSNLQRKGIELKKDFFYDYDNMGTISQKQERFEKPIKLLEKAIALDSNFFSAHVNIGTILQNLKHYEEAGKHFERAIQIDSTYPGLYSRLGVSVFRAGDTEKAINLCEKAISMAVETMPWKAALYANTLGVLYAEIGRSSKAIELFKKAIELNPKYTLPMRNMAIRYINLGQYDKAIYRLLQSLNIDAESPVTYKHLGSVFLKNHRWEDAEWMLQKSIELNPRYVSAINLLIECYRIKGQFEKVLAWQEKLKETDYLQYLVGMESTYFLMGDLDNADKYAKKVDELLIEDISQANQIAFQYYRGKHFKRSIFYFKKVTEDDPDFKWREYNISCGYALLGKPKEAIYWLAQAIEKGYEDFHTHTDPDLASIRNEPAFKALMEKHFPGRVFEGKPPAVHSEPIYYWENCLLLADFYDSEGEYERAKVLWEKAEELKIKSGNE